MKEAKRTPRLPPDSSRTCREFLSSTSPSTSPNARSINPYLQIEPLRRDQQGGEYRTPRSLKNLSNRIPHEDRKEQNQRALPSTRRRDDRWRRHRYKSYDRDCRSRQRSHSYSRSYSLSYSRSHSRSFSRSFSRSHTPPNRFIINKFGKLVPLVERKRSFPGDRKRHQYRAHSRPRGRDHHWGHGRNTRLDRDRRSRSYCRDRRRDPGRSHRQHDSSSRRKDDKKDSNSPDHEALAKDYNALLEFNRKRWKDAAESRKSKSTEAGQKRSCGGYRTEHEKGYRKQSKQGYKKERKLVRTRKKKTTKEKKKEKSKRT
eukprot:TRINITY_DN868_c0_g1_i4.p1 TRINITY_DN868_c0_g1~~TRINITY_DN868_c0_g1_i4.p1  ORF type:complete len:315 (-),score=26.26 TRINITY_DN868_c0_g1_i4:39-983(-)